MNILINLSTLKKGGGQNVALNFLNELKKNKIEEFEFYFVACGNSDIYKNLQSDFNSRIILMPSNPILRMLKEILYGRMIVKKYRIDLIYTYFGIGLFPKFIPQVCGSADSNLYFPEIDFWSDYPGIKRIKKKLIDQYRIYGLKRAQAIIFENEIMQKRGIDIFNLKNTIFIKPSISINNQNSKFILPYSTLEWKYKGLFLCSWQKNKNYMIIPQLAAKLKKMNIDFGFVLTAPQDNSSEYKLFMADVEKYDVSDRVSVIGPVKKNELDSLYTQIDFVFLLSKLESFSNNIIEAWYYKKVLIIADELWSRSICGNAAVYVKRESINDISYNIMRVLNEKERRAKIIERGEEILLSYPTIEQKTRQELNYLKHIYEIF